MTLPRLSDTRYPSFPSFIDKFLEGDLMDWTRSNFADMNTTLPAVNVKENENEYQIDVAAPGLQKNDFDVNYDNGMLTISSEKKEENEEKEGEKVTRKEFSYQSFQRSFGIPENVVNADKITAKYTDGILHVVLPKKDEARPKPAKQIKIS